MSLSWAQPSSFGRTSQVNDDVVLKTRSEGQLQIRAIENIEEQNSFCHTGVKFEVPDCHLQ